MTLLWQVLIPTIPHRHARLCELLADLDRQAQPGFGVLLFRDNLEHTIAEKRQQLLSAATAEYISFIDDDDAVVPTFIHRILTELSPRPDYIGFPVEWVVDGVVRSRVEHSIRYGGWHEWPEKLIRDISHLNPIRREIALLGTFAGGYSEDSRWATMIRDSGRVHEEAWILDLMYRYRFSTTNCADSPRVPYAPDAIQPLPRYPWLVLL